MIPQLAASRARFPVGEIDGHAAARFEVCRANAGEITRVYRGGCAYARTRDRRQHRHFLDHQYGAAAAAVLREYGTAYQHLRLKPREGADGDCSLLYEASAPSAADADDGKRRRVLLVESELDWAGRARANQRQQGERRILSRAGHFACAWPRLPSCGRPDWRGGRGHAFRRVLAQPFPWGPCGDWAHHVA